MVDKGAYDAGEEGAVKKRKTKAQLAKERELEEFRQLMQTYGGRAFIWWLLELCGVYRTSFTNDNDLTNFNEGQRQVGLHIIERIVEAGCLDEETRMKNEAKVRNDG